MRFDSFQPANDNDLADYGDFTVTLPDPIAIERSARNRQGRGRTHPSHRSCAVEAGPTPAEPVSDDTRFTIVSQNAPCMLFRNRRQSRFGGLSAKTRRLVSGVGPHELAAWKEFETNQRWVDFDMQTARVAWTAVANQASYLADSIAVDDIGDVHTQEIKADPSYFAEPDYDHVMRHAEQGFGEAGMAFEKLIGPALRGSERKQLNVDRAFGDRFTYVSPQARNLVQSLLKKAPIVALGEIEDLLDNDPLTARAKANALLCERAIGFGLDQRLTRETLVTAPVWPSTFPDIRALRYDNDN